MYCFEVMESMKVNSFSLKTLILFVLLSNVVTSELSHEHKIIETDSGKVRGTHKTTLIKHIGYYAFKGIPYATSPTEERRFKPPEPVESWSPAIHNATEHGNTCVQPIHPLGDVSQQSEDCLFLNIYVPEDLKSDEKVAVLVHIHGGGFGVGSANDDTLGPDFLIEQRVIVATMNYRLGVFGFMSFGTPEYSGNMGLKDQQLALKWIHSNIEHFSGDNQRITLMGTSAGGVSTHFHMLSPQSRKYFRNAIPMGGTIDVYWGLNGEGDNLNEAHKIAEELGEPKQSVEELIEFFKAVPAEKLGPHGHIGGIFQRLSQVPFAPVIEKKDADRPILVDMPSQVYKDSKVDVDAMFGFSASEFLTFYSNISQAVYNFSDLDGNFSLALPFKGADLAFDSPEYLEIVKEIREFYFKNETIDDKQLLQYINLLSDVNFQYGIDKSAKQHARSTNSKTFYYRFSVDSKLNILKHVLGNAGHLPGAGHGGDSCYMFRCSIFQPFYDAVLQNKDDEQSKLSLKTVDDITRLVANFAKYGEPTHNGDPVAGFLPIQNDQVNFLDLTNDGLKPGVDPNRETNALWAGIEQQIAQINASGHSSSHDDL